MNNVTPGTIAKDVNITDIGLPEGLVLSGGMQGIECWEYSSRSTIRYRTKRQDQAFELRQTESHLEADENGFSFYCSYVPYSLPVTIIFHCTALENANGHESVNVASVTSSNAPEKSDDAEVYVNTGEFQD